MPLRFFTKKSWSKEWRKKSELRQCLSLFDLTMIGIGSILGSGLFIVTGLLARNVAGPSLIFAFMIAAIPSLIMGLCYAEFASRIPNVGASYVYTQVSLGEIWGFIVGWNYFTGSIVSAAAIARSSSEYIDSFLNEHVNKFFAQHMSYGHIKGLAEYPDFLAVLILIFVLIFVVLGVRHSSTFINIVTFIKLLVILFMIIVGIYFANPDNWSTPEKFAPFGIPGIFAASAQCLYSFGGIDAVAMATEEASDRQNPSRAIYFALSVSIVVYITVSAVLTLMAPYSLLSKYAPLAEAYDKWAFSGAKYVVSVGALCATLSALLVTCFMVTRVMFAMANDGLFPAFFDSVNQSRQVPIRSAVFSGILIAITSLLMDVHQLVELISTTMIVSSILLLSGVILTRYQPGLQSVKFETAADSNHKSRLSKCCPCIGSTSVQTAGSTTGYQPVSDLFNSVAETDEDKTLFQSDCSEPDKRTNSIANICVTCIIVFTVVLCTLLTHGMAKLKQCELWAIFSTVILIILILIALVILYRQPRNKAVFPSMVPGVPFIPLLSLVVDVILLVNLSFWTYIRFAVCSMIGLCVYLYFTYPWTDNNPGCNSDEGRSEVDSLNDVED